MSVMGTWFSSTGSKLSIRAEGSELAGTFQSSQDGSVEQPVHGRIDQASDEATHRGLSFSVSWPPAEGYPSSVTTYTGQYRHLRDGSEEIEVIFLIVDGTESRALWRSTGLSSDLFTRMRP